jgi:hypothetical protein
MACSTGHVRPRWSISYAIQMYCSHQIPAEKNSHAETGMWCTMMIIVCGVHDDSVAVSLRLRLYDASQLDKALAIVMVHNELEFKRWLLHHFSQSFTQTPRPDRCCCWRRRVGCRSIVSEWSYASIFRTPGLADGSWLRSQSLF